MLLILLLGRSRYLISHVAQRFLGRTDRCGKNKRESCSGFCFARMRLDRGIALSVDTVVILFEILALIKV